MNPKALVINTMKCELCDFKISEFHHYFPETRGGEKTGSKSGVYLCPNHHRLANILQIQIELFCLQRGCMPEELKVDDFNHLDVFFDEIFKEKIIDFIMGYDWGRREHLIHIGAYE